MRVMDMRRAAKTYPTGDPKFAVMQSFPAGFAPEESDPFLMCDHFSETVKRPPSSDPDEFPISWHPHRGMDLVTYLREGVGRHADSMGNRESFASPGMQWISSGSGIEHAEAAETPVGQRHTGFQIWINVPAVDKMRDPAYGTEPADRIPTLRREDGVVTRVLAGTHAGSVGPFRTVAAVQMCDYDFEARAAGGGLRTVEHTVPRDLDNCLVLCHTGRGVVNGVAMQQNDIVRLDATDADGARVLEIATESNDAADGAPAAASFLVFCGRRLHERVAWRGPIVMSTDGELQTAFQELRRGTFLKRRAAWDFRRLSAFPKDHPALSGPTK